MSHRIFTLPLRLTFWFLAIFGGIQFALWLIVGAGLSQYMGRRFDQEMVDRALLIAETIEVARTEEPNASPLTIAKFLAPLEGPGTMVQLRRKDVTSIYRSKTLRDASLPPPDKDLAERQTPIFQTLPRPLPTGFSARGPLRLLTMPIGAPEHREYYVEIGADLAPVDQLSAELEQLLAVFLFVSLVVGAVTAWLVARRHLSPLGDIARRAREISVSQLGERVPEPRQPSEITELVQVINEMLERLETEFHNQQQFVAEASHELKTPLAVLISEARSIIKHDDPGSTNAAYARSVEEESRRLLNTVEGFMILSRALSGRPLRFGQRVPVEDAVLRAVDRSRRAPRAERVRIVPTFDARGDAIEPHVVGDADLLCAMFENLLYNAVRHSPDGERVEVHVSVLENAIEIQVRDYGPGIPSEDILRVFDIYHQAAPGGAAGIGLSIVKTVAEMHGGCVSVKNMPDKGCIFTVHLPLASNPATETSGECG